MINKDDSSNLKNESELVSDRPSSDTSTIKASTNSHESGSTPVTDESTPNSMKLDVLDDNRTARQSLTRSTQSSVYSNSKKAIELASHPELQSVLADDPQEEDIPVREQLVDQCVRRLSLELTPDQQQAVCSELGVNAAERAAALYLVKRLQRSSAIVPVPEIPENEEMKVDQRNAQRRRSSAVITRHASLKLSSENMKTEQIVEFEESLENKLEERNSQQRRSSAVITRHASVTRNEREEMAEEEALDFGKSSATGHIPAKNKLEQISAAAKKLGARIDTNEKVWSSDWETDDGDNVDNHHQKKKDVAPLNPQSRRHIPLPKASLSSLSLRRESPKVKNMSLGIPVMDNLLKESTISYDSTDWISEDSIEREAPMKQEIMTARHTNISDSTDDESTTDEAVWAPSSSETDELQNGTTRKVDTSSDADIWTDEKNVPSKLDQIKKKGNDVPWESSSDENDAGNPRKSKFNNSVDYSSSTWESSADLMASDVQKAPAVVNVTKVQDSDSSTWESDSEDRLPTKTTLKKPTVKDYDSVSPWSSADLEKDPKASKLMVPNVSGDKSTSIDSAWTSEADTTPLGVAN